MKIWLGSWNVEQQFPDNSMISKWVLQSGGGQTAHVIALGFQEATRAGRINALPGYSQVAGVTVEGRTHNTKNCQNLFVFVRTAEHSKGVGLRDQAKLDTAGVASSSTTTMLPIKEYGKGGAVAMVHYTPRSGGKPWRIAIFTAHLDSKKTETRQGQITTLLNLVQDVNYDVAFLMGDLNYRVNSNTLMPISAASMADLIGYQRLTLYAQDSFNVNDFGGGWTFPDPCDGAPNRPLYLPTYKRHYKGEKGNAARNAVGQLPAPDAVRACFNIDSDKKGMVEESGRAGQFDLGWLDRIGYKVNNRSLIVNQVKCGSCADLVLSDHTPVYSMFTIKSTARPQGGGSGEDEV
jgi:endonuclease/exonuclease/phosphatase family metal-dependent hydrolase